MIPAVPAFRDTRVPGRPWTRTRGAEALDRAGECLGTLRPHIPTCDLWILNFPRPSGWSRGPTILRMQMECARVLGEADSLGARVHLITILDVARERTRNAASRCGVLFSCARSHAFRAIWGIAAKAVWSSPATATANHCATPTANCGSPASRRDAPPASHTRDAQPQRAATLNRDA